MASWYGPALVMGLVIPARRAALRPIRPAQMSPSGRISRTVQGFPVGGEEVRALPVGQFPEDPLRVQRILRTFSGLGAHGVMVRPGAGDGLGDPGAAGDFAHDPPGAGCTGIMRSTQLGRRGGGSTRAGSALRC